MNYVIAHANKNVREIFFDIQGKLSGTTESIIPYTYSINTVAVKDQWPTVGCEHLNGKQFK